MKRPLYSLAPFTIAVVSALTTWASAPNVAHAQAPPRWELSAGATRSTTSSIVDGASTGWIIGAGWNANGWLGVDLLLNRFDRSQSVTFLEIDARFRSVLVGPRVTWRGGALHPFGRVLVGRTKVDLTVTSNLPFPSTGSSDESHDTVHLATGLDLPIVAGSYARLTYDYRRIFAVKALNLHGLSANFVYRFGGS